MERPDGGAPDGYFNKGRLRAGVMLICAAIGLMTYDAFSPDYALDSGQLALMFGTATVLLGVEAGKRFLGR